MKNFINRTQVKAMTAVCSTKQEAQNVIARAKAVLADRSGQGALDTAIQVLIGIVLGALILGGLYLILNATVLPTITERIRDMFNYKG